jgi:PAS domain S-box-containing protein
VNDPEEVIHSGGRAGTVAPDRFADVAAQILERISDAFYAVDRDWRLTYVNRRVEAMVGKRRDEMLGRNVFDLFPEARGSESHAAHLRARRENRPVSFQAVSAVNGRWIEGTVYPDETGLSVYLRDITARKRAEEQLRASERRERARAAELEAVLDAVPAVVWLAHDPECRAITGNRASYEFLRLPYGANESKTAPAPGPTNHFAVYANGVELAPEELPMQRAARGEEVRSHEEEVVFRDGTSRYLYGDAVPLREEDGTICGAVGAFLDVTERKHAEAELKRSREELDDFFENAAVALHWIGPDGRILRANQAELDLLGYTRETYVGRHIAEFHADRSVIEDILARLGRGETLDRYPARLRARDGSIRDVLISSSALFRDGRFVHTRCITVDVTERKQAEEHQKLLMAELNHRVKNTLAVVQSIAAQTLRRAASLEGFAESFTGRLQALAAAHGLLTQGTWRATSLIRLIRRVLKAHGTGTRAIEMSGPDIELTPKQTLALSLVFHELATNAAKHGALSVPNGRLAIAWAVEEAPGGPRLGIDWIERNGPAVCTPVAAGFGTTLIQRTMAYDLNGDSALCYEPAGLRCRLAFPWREDGAAASG